MSQAINMLALVLALVVFRASASIAESPKEVAANAASITAGASIDDAKKILTAAKIPESGLKAFARLKDDDAWLFYSVEPQVDLVLGYSTRTRKIESVTFYYLARPRTKSNEVAVSAQSVNFAADGSYIVHFARPRRLK